jgi:putative membrane protein
MNKLSLFLRGIVIGATSLGVPGLSASTIAIVLAVYYDMIYAISHILKKPKQSITFLLFLLAGYGVGCLAGAWAVNALYERFPIPVIAAVVGFLIATVPRMMAENKEDFKRPSNWAVMIMVSAVFLVYALVITNGETVSFDKELAPIDFIMMSIVGMVTSATLVIPGVDFAVTLMALGYYTAFIGLVGDLPALFAHPSRLFLMLFYLVGYGVGSFLFSKGLRYLIKRFPRQLNCANLAMVAVAPIVVIKKCIIDNPNPKTYLSNITWKAWMWAFIMFAAGYFAFTWVPALLRYVWIVPKNPSKQAEKEIVAAEIGIPVDDVTTAQDEDEWEIDRKSVGEGKSGQSRVG